MSAATIPVWSETQPTVARTTTQRTIMLYCAIAFAAALYLLPFVRTLSGAPDEGIYLYNAQRVVEGAIPGRDFLQENPPLAYYWLALFFKLFGVTFVATRLCLFASSLGTAVAMYFLSRRICMRYRTLPSILLAGTYFGSSWPAISHRRTSK